MMSIELERAKIDELDRKMIALFEEQMDIALRIAKLKEENHIQLQDVPREEKRLLNGLDALKNKELSDYVRDFMNHMIRINKTYQKDHVHQHIFLVGMPGAGKTTIGRALAQDQGMNFFDIDAVVQEKAGKSIQNIIIHDGEDAFRELEFKAIQEIVDTKTPSVVATGGGTVLSEKTVELMRESGFVVFIQRDVTQILDDLDMEIRPLLKESIEYIFRLYEERQPLYEAVSHVKVENISNISNAVAAIVNELPFREIR